MRPSTLVLLLVLIGWSFGARAASNVFSSDVQMCSGRPWVDIMCNGADPTGVADSTAAINATFNAAITNGWTVLFPPGTFKVTSKISVNFQGQAANGLEVISRGAMIDGRTIVSGNVIQFDCSGGTTVSPAVCNGLKITGQLTVAGNTSGYVVVLGNTDFSDHLNAARIEHLVVTNSGTGGAIQANFLTDGDLWLSGSTNGGSSSIGAVALEQVQTSRIGGYGSALGASAPALLIENGASSANSIVAFSYDPNTSTCVSIASPTAFRNAWLVPSFPCTTAVNASGTATQNVLIGPTFAGTNAGPTSTGIAIVGRGSLNRFAAPAVSSKTLFGTDDGTVFSPANATGPSVGFSAASLPVTLPNPSAVGSGYTVGFVSDNGKAVVVNTAGGTILVDGQQLSQLVVSGPPNALNYEFTVLTSDGANWRIEGMSQNAALLNDIQTSLPARWEHPGGPGYQLTRGDNGMVVHSDQTISGLAVTLPSTATIQQGYMFGVAATAGKPITLNGGPILLPTGVILTSFVLNQGMQVFQFDGSSFRQILGAQTNYCQSITEFGGRGDNSTDNTAAWNAAVATTACVSFPPGNYFFASSITYTIPTPTAAVTIQGSGSEVTLLRFSGTNGLTIVYDGVQSAAHIGRFSFLTSSVGTYDAITLTQPGNRPSPAYDALTTINDVTFRGSDGYGATNYWANGVTTNWVSNINFTNDWFYGPGNQLGTGIALVGGTGLPQTGIFYNVIGSSFVSLNTGIFYGGQIQGLQVSSSGFLSNVNGIYIPAPLSNQSQLSVTNSNFGFNTVGINDVAGTDAQITGNQFFAEASGQRDIVTNSGAFSITGNGFNGEGQAGAFGIDVGPGGANAGNGVISGNSIAGFSGAGSAGIRLGSAVLSMIITGNQYTGNLENVLVQTPALSNVITMQRPGLSGTAYFSYCNVIGAADNGSGLVRLTCSGSITNSFFSGESVLISDIGGLTGFTGAIVGNIIVVDSTHLDIMNSTFIGSYTGGGRVSSMP